MSIFHALVRVDDAVLDLILLMMAAAGFWSGFFTCLVLFSTGGSFCAGLGALIVEGGFRMLANLMDLLLAFSFKV